MADKHEQVWQQYAMIWSETDLNKRNKAFNEVLSEDFSYTDPFVNLNSYKEFGAYMDEFQKNTQGGSFKVTSFISHNKQSLAEWELFDGNKNLIQKGKSYGQYDNDDKLIKLTGFFEVE